MLKLKLQYLATWCEELSHWKRPWCWERLKARGEGDNRGWDGWMASPSRWTWVWTSSGSWWWTGKPGVLQSMGSQRVRHDWATFKYVFYPNSISQFQFSHSVVSNSLQPHGLQHARSPCPSSTPGVYPNSCPLSQWCHPTISSRRPLLLPSSIFPSIKVFPTESALRIRWPKYWSFSFSSSPSNEYSGLIAFRMDWLDLLAVLGSLKSLVQHHSSKASVLRHSAFFIVQLSHPYMTIGKMVALARWTFVGKVMSLLLICCLGWS